MQKGFTNVHESTIINGYLFFILSKIKKTSCEFKKKKKCDVLWSGSKTCTHCSDLEYYSIAGTMYVHDWYFTLTLKAKEPL